MDAPCFFPGLLRLRLAMTKGETARNDVKGACDDSRERVIAGRCPKRSSIAKIENSSEVGSVAEREPSDSIWSI